MKAYKGARLEWEKNQSIRKRRLCPEHFRGKCDRSCKFLCNTCNGHHNVLLHYERKSDNKNTNSAQPSNFSAAESSNVTSPKTDIYKFKNLSCFLLNCAHNYINGWVGSYNTTIDELSCLLLATAFVYYTDKNDGKKVEIKFY